jgi:GNAT superfamily N-acetyltransferase
MSRGTAPEVLSAGLKPYRSEPRVMEYAVVGWPEDEPTLDLDHREFAYAGKFVMSNTGKAVGRRDGEVLAAVSFNADRTDDAVAWLRYVTVRADRRGEGVGARLAAFATRRLHERGYGTVRIAVNNPFAYHALYRAGFGFTGDETGVAELVLAHPDPADGTDARAAAFRDGLDRFRGRDDLSAEEAAFLDAKVETGPPPVVEPPTAADGDAG